MYIPSRSSIYKYNIDIDTYICPCVNMYTYPYIHNSYITYIHIYFIYCKYHPDLQIPPETKIRRQIARKRTYCST